MEMSIKTEKITMLHGAGGTVMHNLVKNYIVKAFGGIGNAAEVPLKPWTMPQWLATLFSRVIHTLLNPYFSQAETSGVYQFQARSTTFQPWVRRLMRSMRLHFGRRLAHL